MKGNFNVVLLKAEEHTKKDGKDKYYTLSFLDENDKSFNCYISDSIYDSIKTAGLKRYQEFFAELNFYINKDGLLQFNVSGITVPPFKK